jgi:hypothetical protein
VTCSLPQAKGERKDCAVVGHWCERVWKVDNARRERLIARGKREDELADHLAFGRWFYLHMTDPTYQPEVIKVRSEVPMRWDRWSAWSTGDRRRSFEVIDTDALTPGQTADCVAAWIEATTAGDLPAIRFP